MPFYSVNNTMTHFHHVTPKHAGGTDDPSNLREMTIPDHAEAHRDLWIRFGREEDKIAWHMLSGQETNPDQAREQARIAAVRRAMANRKKTPQELAAFKERNPSKLPRNRAKIKRRMKANNPAQRPEVKAKISATQTGKKRDPFSAERIEKMIAPQRGKKRPSMSAKIWVNDGTTNRRVDKNDIPVGWKPGRTTAWKAVKKATESHPRPTRDVLSA